ncbi:MULTISPECIES: sulfurtransferase TusA family protein [Thermaerobacter]|uniref:Redox protein, regulator of disulfide bond formation n=1 Tax=Thermaerobacter subterraneus DSM 13965 TaxID=867903 RepID=K6PS28_9FIRM|nr:MULTISPECIES: sulfurtransferase TusA family protein [Thermaerobacter]EKP95762.1 putative redox protein, regulator of disulfide bond formation [Thermaerobacter subterraneus DSM 13965]QIA27260.1 sulfurtransferase TusA family protein [Thermaerobacter sp. PB12/4term]
MALFKRPNLEQARQRLAALGQANLVDRTGAGTAVTADREIDVTGEICPYPVDAALEALARMAPGQVLAELTDHTISTHTVPAAVERSGLGEVLRIEEKEPGLYRILIRRR